MTKQKPTKNISGDPTKQDIYDHPAFAVMRVNHCHGGNKTLLGSDLKHNDYITIEIAQAQLHRSYGENLVFGTRKPIIKIAMTHAQFASISQSIDNGQGTPVTLQYAPSTLNKDVVMLPDIDPLDSSLDMSKDELEALIKKQVEKAMSLLSEMSDAIKAKKSGKVLLELLSSAQTQVGLLPTNLSSGVTFAKEVLDKTANEVQMNAEATMQHRLKSLGIQSLNGDTNQLLCAPPDATQNKNNGE